VPTNRTNSFSDDVRVWRLAHHRALTLDRPRLIAILNTTPDSFSDGGRYLDPAAALDHAERLAAEGADMLDIGAESTRPGAAAVPDEEQVRRAVPAIERIRASTGKAANLPISIDTTRPAVAVAALDAGADAVNDQSAGMEGETPDRPSPMLELVAQRDAGVILMHRLRAPAADHYSHEYPRAPEYGTEGVVAAVRNFLQERASAAAAAGIPAESIVLDPGLGFGKSVEQNWELFRALAAFESLGRPVLCALSRKSFIGAAMAGPAAGGAIPPPSERIKGSIAAALSLALQGVRLFRVHDVGEHARAFESAAALIRSMG
jgi:dihydropteroate synthase